MGNTTDRFDNLARQGNITAPAVITPENQFKASFIVPNPSKTLKVRIKEGVSLEIAIRDAYRYLESQEEYTRIEFRYYKNYMVVAKLKEDEN